MSRPGTPLTAPLSGRRPAVEIDRHPGPDWDRRRRRLFGLVTAVAAVLVALGLTVSLLWPAIAWYGGLLSGCAVCSIPALRLSPRAWIERHHARTLGEQRTAQAVAALPEGWLVLPDLVRAGGRTVDHVVVGPAGVVLLDSKGVGGGGPVRSAAVALSSALARAGARTCVQAVVVVWGDWDGPVEGHVAGRGISWVTGPTLVDWLAAQPPVGRPDRVRVIASVLRSGAVPL
jgi:hypothetical protein